MARWETEEIERENKKLYQWTEKNFLMGFLPYLHDFWIVIKVSNFVCEKSSLSIWIFVLLHQFFNWICAVKFEIFHLGFNFFLLFLSKEILQNATYLDWISWISRKYSQEKKYMSNLESLHLIYTNTKPYGRFIRLMFSSISPFPPETRHTKKLDSWLVSKPKNKYLFLYYKQIIPPGCFRMK